MFTLTLRYLRAFYFEKNTIMENTIKPQREPIVPLLLALSGYIIWGFMPLYLKQLSEVSPWVITANRVLWTLPWACLFAILIHGRNSISVSKKTVMTLLLSAVFIGTNWTIYAWCIVNGRIMETALGYFINPLMNVFVGVLFFKEKIDKTKFFALLLAFSGVAYQTIAAHHLPVLGLLLAGLFVGYSIVRKQVVVAPAAGLFWESLLLFPLAAIALFMLSKSGLEVHGANPKENILLLAAGPITAVPLILFAFGARALKLMTLGMLQYIAPTIVLIISIYYGEVFDLNRMITFGLIWAGLLIYTWSEFRRK